MPDHGREPGDDETRPSDDEMSDNDTNDPTSAELEAGRAALRELGAPPLPAEVVARLEGRLADEPGLVAPAHRAVRRRRVRLALVAPGFGVALAAVVAIAVISTHGSTPRPTAASTVSALEKTRALSPKASATAGAQASDAVPEVRVPSLIGRPYAEAEALLRRLGLRLVPGHLPCPAPGSGTVSAQAPAAGTRVASASAVRIRQRCGS
jgi:PASTA domain